MKQKFIIKHLSSWSPLVQKLLEHIAAHTSNNDMFPASALVPIVSNYVNRLPKGLYEYDYFYKGNAFMLYEDDELVLHIELIEINELKPQEIHY